ncbi:MAG: M28 family peptidase [Gammaproteobacteria bacterium]|nr:M28 family peptidase [Gammaproteobacteria bacterium]
MRQHCCLRLLTACAGALAALAIARVASSAERGAPGPATSGAATAHDPERTARQLRESAATSHDVAYEWVRDLTTRFGARPAGSESEQRAAEWAAARLKAFGFENVHTESFPLTAWVRGNEIAQLTAPAPQVLTVAALGGSPPTPAGALEGEVVIFPTLADLRAAPADSLRGRIAMVAQRMVRTEDGAGYGVVVEARSEGPDLAAQRGAIAFVMRSAGTDSHRLAHTGTTRYVNGRVAIPAFALSNPDADQVERLAAFGTAVRARLFSTAAYVPGAHSQNVIADLRGSDRSEQTVLLGAHLDSWDLGTGAIDDGTGTAIIVAAAKLMRDLPYRPRRTVRVVLFGSEEVAQPSPPGGAFGGHSYADNHRAELPNHVLAGESDLGADRIYAVTLPPAVAGSEFAKAALRVLTPIGVLLKLRSREEAGTDIEPSVEAGVPAFILSQDASRYFDVHHTADDTLDKVDRAQLEQNVTAWAALVWLAADSDIEFRTAAAPVPRS